MQLLANFLGGGDDAMPNDVVTRAIDAVCAGDHLTADHAAAVLARSWRGAPTRCRRRLPDRPAGEGGDGPELVGLARTMRALRRPVETRATDLVDTAGTGGGPSTFNVSTTAALVAAAPAARSPSTATARNTAAAARPTCWRRSASTIDLDPTQVGRCIDEVGFGFMFAPAHHAAMATSSRSARSSACARSSTSSAR
jgi:anthranilate phosphoribosyltransferase